MTATQQEWLAEKRVELLKCVALYGPVVSTWDMPKFFQIIDEKAREIRRLKTQLNQKEK